MNHTVESKSLTLNLKDPFQIKQGTYDGILPHGGANIHIIGLSILLVLPMLLHFIDRDGGDGGTWVK